MALPKSTHRTAMLADAFVPKRPKSWDSNAHEWLTSVDIDAVLHQYAKACPHFHYTGFSFMDFAADVRAPLAVRPDFEPVSGGGGGSSSAWIDWLAASKEEKEEEEEDATAPDSKTPEYCVMPKICALDLAALVKRGVTLVATVLNLSRHVEEGTHWVFVVIWLPPTPSGSTPPQFVYVDSNADTTPPEITAWHEKMKAQCRGIWKDAAAPTLVLRNNTVARQTTDTECGLYCLYSIVSLVQGRWLKVGGDEIPRCASADAVPRMLDDLLDKRTNITDGLVAKFREIFFRAT